MFHRSVGGGIFSQKGTNGNGDGEITQSRILEPEEKSGEREKETGVNGATCFLSSPPLCSSEGAQGRIHEISPRPRRGSACEQNTETWPGSGPEVAEAY